MTVRSGVVTPSSPQSWPVVRTDRLELRAPREADRDRFVDLFRDGEFMVFSAGVLSEPQAHARFDRMLRNTSRAPFAKQPIIERSSSRIVGYCGVDWFIFEGEERPEFGWRLVPDARGRGYATEASRALLTEARRTFRGDVLAIIDFDNEASQNVARKLGFTAWKHAMINGFPCDIVRLG